ncbi:hypothetical protein [Spongiactinospora sp. 9N601]|uniref:hypothetical protein n=1 Tax=Spongiactinospora sp. 9N601 TaxID=3375149 RepID=UPI00379A5614
MKDKKFCGVTGSQSTQRVINRFPAGWDTEKHMVRQRGHGACVQMLRDGKVDAVEMIRDGTWEKIIRACLGQSADRFIRTVPAIPGP